ncbi:unnamed protein product [Adineta ricciae]|uniref:TFIIS N-terminal domain-containing protein n=1 Tax=Adineta ricciae TaxID=249248 RepID=A0A816A7P0_ADIRI|nr:unnamed protein product [Adineta ricciae]
MAPVDPCVLLNTIIYLLDKNGGLKNTRIVRQFITLMKLAEKLVNKAIYLQILSHTQSEEIFTTFLKSDGHQILFKWLSHFSSENNHAFLLDTLNILGHLPFNLNTISQNHIDELQLKIAELASAESGKAKDIRESARHLYDIWSSKELFKPIDIRSSQLDINQPTCSNLPLTPQSIDKPSPTSSKSNQNERTLLSSNFNTSRLHDRKMATTVTLTPVAASATNTSSSGSNSNSADTNKRKSEENIGPPTHRKPTHRRISAPVQSDSAKMKASVELDDSDDLTKTNALNKSTPTYRIPKIGRPNASIPSPPSEPMESPPVANQASKTVVSLNRQTSDELNAQQAKRKFSLSQYKERKRLKSNEMPQNSLEDTDMRIQNTGQSKPSPPMNIEDEPVNTSETQLLMSPKVDEAPKDTVIKSNLSEPGVKKVVKKKVIWADEKNQSLVHTSFFEVDDSELSDMHVFARTCAANISIAQLEKVMERDLRKRRGVQDMNSNDNDDRQYSTPLPPLIKISIPDSIQTPQIVSQERFVQEEREKTVLQALFIRSFLPDTPGEPDGDPVGTSNTERSEPKVIPLEDDTSSSVSSKVTSVNNNNTTTATPSIPLVSTNPTATTSTATPSLSTFSFGNVSPEVAQILAQAQGNLTSATTNNFPTTNTSINSPATPIITTPIVATAAAVTLPNTTVSATPTLAAPPNFLSAFINATRTIGNESANVPPPNPIANLLPNIPLNFNLPPPPSCSLTQLIANALTLGIPPPPTGNPTLFQTPSPAAFNAPTPQPTLPNPIINSVPPPAVSSKTPTVRFVSAMGNQQLRANHPNNNNNNHHDRSMPSSRENSRDPHFRRGPPPNNRRDYYQNRNNNNNNNNNNHNNNNNNHNNNNNNNRNIFS